MALRQFSSSFAQGEFQFLIVFPVVIRTFVPVSGMRTGARPPNRECKQFGLLLSMGMFLGPGRNRIQTGARPPTRLCRVQAICLLGTFRYIEFYCRYTIVAMENVLL